MAPTDAEIQEILTKVAGTHFASVDPLVSRFFDFDPQPNTPQIIRMHKWVTAPVLESDTRRMITGLAKMAITDLNRTTTSLAGELVFRTPRLLPAPTYVDGLPLFSRGADDDVGFRFGVKGGNIVESAGCLAKDVDSASKRLAELGSSALGANEQVTIFCARPLVRRLIRASVKAGLRCKVLGIKDYESDKSWVITREKAPCGLAIGRPAFPIPASGNRLVIGAQFMVWIVDPRLAVCVEHRVN